MKILIDTCIWADHFRAADARLTDLVREGRVLMHPFVVGELAMGNLRNRKRTLAALSALPDVTIAPAHTLLQFVDDQALGGTGLGLVDAHLLFAAQLSDAGIWTRDRRLGDRAAALSLRWTG